MNIYRFAILFIPLSISLSAYSEYRTPGNGTTYSLDSLATAAGGAIVDGNGTFILSDRVIIVCTDRLEVSNDTLMVETTQLGSNEDLPFLYVEGTLVANNFIMQSTPVDSMTGELRGGGIIVNGVGTECEASVSLTDCRFEDLSVGVSIRGDSETTLNRCRFSNCKSAGLYVFADGAVTVQNSTLSDSSAVAAGEDQLVLEDCQFTGRGLALINSNENTQITRCTIQNADIGIYGSAQK